MSPLHVNESMPQLHFPVSRSSPRPALSRGEVGAKRRVRGGALREIVCRSLGSVLPTRKAANPGERSASPLTPPLSPRKSGARERAAVVATLFSERPRDRGLRLVLDLPQMLFAAKTLRIDLVDVLGARRPRGEPAVVGTDLDAAERLAVSRRSGELARTGSPASSFIASCSGDSAFSRFFCAGVAGASMRS